MVQELVVLDSSVWIEILNEGPLFEECKKILDAAKRVIVPIPVIFEVGRKVQKSVSEEEALSVISWLAQNEVKDLSQEIALQAIDLSIKHSLLAMDSMVLAYAVHFGCKLVTLDNDFSGLPSTVVLRK